MSTVQASSSSSVPVTTLRTNPLSNKERKKAFYQTIIANYKAKKQANLPGKLSGNADKIPKINEDRVGSNEKYELIHIVGEISKRARGPIKSRKAINYPSEVNNYITFKRQGGPSKLDKTKGHFGKVSKLIGGTKKPSKADIHADKFQRKSTVGVRVNGEHKFVLPVEDLRYHLDRLYQVQENMNEGDLLARSFVFIRLLSNQPILRSIVTIPEGAVYYLKKFMRKRELVHATINIVGRENPTEGVANAGSSADGYFSDDNDGVYRHTRSRV